MSMPWDADLNYYHNLMDFDLDPHEAQAITLGPVNMGVGYSQTLENIPACRFEKYFEIEITEANNTQKLLSGVNYFTVQEMVNYVQMGSSAHGAELHLSIGDVRWVDIGVDPAIAWTAYGQWVGRTGSSGQIYQFPTQRNILFCLAVMPPIGFVSPWEDGASVVFGYNPAWNTERLIVHP